MQQLLHINVSRLILDLYYTLEYIDQLDAKRKAELAKEKEKEEEKVKENDRTEVVGNESRQVMYREIAEINQTCRQGISHRILQCFFPVLDEWKAWKKSQGFEIDPDDTNTESIGQSLLKSKTQLKRDRRNNRQAAKGRQRTQDNSGSSDEADSPAGRSSQHASSPMSSSKACAAVSPGPESESAAAAAAADNASTSTPVTFSSKSDLGEPDGGNGKL